MLIRFFHFSEVNTETQSFADCKLHIRTRLIASAFSNFWNPPSSTDGLPWSPHVRAASDETDEVEDACVGRPMRLTVVEDMFRVP